jgi:hypothetical protein
MLMYCRTFTLWLKARSASKQMIDSYIDKTYESKLVDNMWTFEYQHGYLSSKHVFDVLSDITIEADEYIEVWLQHEHQEPIMLYHGRTFHLNALPCVYLPMHTLAVISTAPFTVKCKAGHIPTPLRGQLYNERHTLVINGKPAWVVHMNIIYAT